MAGKPAPPTIEARDREIRELRSAYQSASVRAREAEARADRWCAAVNEVLLVPGAAGEGLRELREEIRRLAHG